MRRFVYSVIALFFICSIIQNGLAQTTNSDESPIEEIAIVATRVASPLSQLPNNISVLSKENLNLLGAVHIQQALSQVPGVNYQRGNGQESLPSIRSAVLTGAGACGSVLILEEGIPVRGAGSCNVNELFDTHFEQAQRIEVVRGANTAFYGSNSLTGSINVSLANQGANELSIELGENTFARIKAGVSYRFNDESYGRLAATLAHDGGFRDSAGFKQNKLSWRHHTNLSQWQLDAGFTATDLDQETAGFITGRGSYLDPSLRQQNQDPEAFRDTQAVRVWLGFSRSIGDNQTIAIRPYFRATEMDFRLHFLPGDPLEHNSQTGMGIQSSLTSQVSDSVIWSIGLDVELNDSELIQTQENPTQGSAFLQATIPTGVHYDYQVNSTQIGAFAHIHWQLNNNIRLIGGFRVESIHYDYDNRSLDGRTRDDGTECGFGGCRYSRPADRDDRFSDFSPRLEFQYQLSDQWQWHIGIADTFRAPQATELYRLQRAQQVANLDSVGASSIETGLKWQHDTGFIYTTLYHIDQRNLIIRDADFFNIDGQRTDSIGLEINAQQQLSKQLSTRLVMSVADHQYNNDLVLNGTNINGNEVDTAPSTYGSAFLAWQVNRRLFSELELQHVGGYFLDIQNNNTYPGHSIVNWRSQYQMNERIKLSLRVLNLTNRFFAKRADFTTFTNERYFPGEPRSVFGELRWTF